MYIQKVSSIRTHNITITKEPIVYCWWFKTNCYIQLFSLLGKEIDYTRIVTKEIDKEIYGLLYIGKGKNGHGRLINYHIHDSQNFHNSGVENGRLSSLRQTLCGLLQLPMTTSKELINNFINENCAIEYDVCELNQLDVIEHNKIRGNYLPLNYQSTKDILTKEHRKILRKCKREMRR
jgi:hypothetical protein